MSSSAGSRDARRMSDGAGSGQPPPRSSLAPSTSSVASAAATFDSQDAVINCPALYN